MAELQGLSQLAFSKASVNNRFFLQQSPFPSKDPLLFVIPSEGEGSAVPRTHRGKTDITLNIQ
jgi:hypothetical protein